jgi:hypothetical protein
MENGSLTVGANVRKRAKGFEPPTPWSRSRPLRNYKCCVWCRLPEKTATNLLLENGKCKGARAARRNLKPPDPGIFFFFMGWAPAKLTDD